MAEPENPLRRLVVAIVAGDVDAISQLLAADPGLVVRTLPGNPRSMLHHATDWPGHRPNVGATIALLVAAGADPNVAMPLGDKAEVAETPLHWAASANDVAAVEALLEAGAEVDALGGIFGGCTPYEEAIIFEQYDTARRLLAAGATDYLPGAAALGHGHLIDDFFDDAGEVRLDLRVLPNWDPLPSRQTILDRAFQFACRAGHLTIATTLLERGADPQARTPVDTSPLDEAADNGHTAVVEWLTGLADPG